MRIAGVRLDALTELRSAQAIMRVGEFESLLLEGVLQQACEILIIFNDRYPRGHGLSIRNIAGVALKKGCNSIKGS